MSNDLWVEPLTPTIGAMVHGIDLCQPLSDGEFNAISNAWMKHLVLFFVDQPLEIETLQSLGRRFGKLHVHPEGIDVKGHPGVIAVYADKESKTYAGRAWHSDVSCEEEPPAGSILHLHEVPETGGDTLFSNMYAAYEALSESMKKLLLGLTAFHSGRPDYEGYHGRKLEEMRDRKFPEAVHPVVRTHPITQRKALFVNELFTQRIVELQPTESHALLSFLYDHIAEPRFQCRFRWRRNSVAMWDNRCTQHLALWDYWPNTRSGHRVTICGDRPA